MSKPRYYIKSGQAFRIKIPVIGFVALWLLMDRLKAPEWLYGIYWFCAVVLFIIVLVDRIKHDDEEVDIEDFLKEKYEEQRKKKVNP